MPTSDSDDVIKIPQHILDGFARDRAKVLALCEEIGFGHVMQVASELWQERDSKGSIVTGPCKHFTQPCVCRTGNRGKCKCFGCGWVFKKEKG